MSYSDSAYIYLRKKILDWQWFSDVNTAHFFIYCLLKANWESGSWKGIKYERGQFIASLETIARESGLSIQNTRTAIKHLISTQELTQSKAGKYRIFTVVKYDYYQQCNTISNNVLTINQQESNKELTTDNKVNKEKEVKEVNKELSNDNSNSQTIVHHKKIVEKWNTLKDYGVPTLRGITPNSIRERDLKARLKEFGENSFDEIIEHFKISKFLQGKATDFKPGFDWAIKKSWYAAILEGKYDDERHEKKKDNDFTLDDVLKELGKEGE